MDHAPEPSDEIPEFVVEYLEEQPLDTLRLIVDYLDGDAGIRDAPQRIVEATSMQDDDTVAEIQAFTADIVTALEGTDHDTLQEATAEGEADDEDDPDDDTMALRYGSL